MLDVLFIVKDRKMPGYCGYGGNFGLYQSARHVCFFLQESGIKCKVVEALDNNYIDRLVKEYKPKLVIIEALWVVPDKFYVLHKLHPKVQWMIRLHSELPFLANEGIATEWIKKYESMRFEEKIPISLSSNSEELIKDLESWTKFKIKYSPNTFRMHENAHRKVPHDKIIDIGMFGALRPIKNPLAQAIAAIRFGDEIDKKVRFHINAGRVEQGGDPVLKNVVHAFDNSQHEVVLHEWYDYTKFQEVVRSMDMGTQVSFSETFNIVTANFVDNGVPIVVSDKIKWMPFWTKADPYDVEDIVHKMHRVYWLGPVLNKCYLNYNNSIALDEWLEWLGLYI